MTAGNRGTQFAGTSLAQTPIAVVVDTSVWGRGDLNIRRLRGLAERLAKSGIEVWVPTQVCLEWASHAANVSAEARTALIRLEKAGLREARMKLPADGESAFASVLGLVDDIPNLRVLPMTGDAAIAGLRDQILGTGPGTSRNGVKTGGVDSSWVRDAVAAAGGNVSKLLFMTGNAKDVRATVDAMGAGPATIRPEVDLYTTLFTTRPAPAHLARVITKYLEDLRDRPRREERFFDRDLAEPETLLDDVTLAPGAFDPLYKADVVDVVLDADVDVVGLSAIGFVEVDSESVLPSVTVDEGDGVRKRAWDAVSDQNRVGVTVECVAVLTGRVHITVFRRGEEGTLDTQAGIALASVRVPLVVDLEDLHIENLAATSSAVATTSDPQFDDGREALEWLLSELADLSGVELVRADYEAGEFEFEGTGGNRAIAILSGQMHQNWSIIFDLGPRSGVVVACQYHSFDADPKYSFSVEHPIKVLKGPYDAIGQVWRHLNQIASD